MSGSPDPRRPGPRDETVEVPLRPHEAAAQPSAEEPWWKNVNSRVPPPPRMPAPRPAPKTPQPPPPPRNRPAAPVTKRHAQATPNRGKGGQLALLIAVGVIAVSAAAVLLMAGLSKFDVLKGKVLDVSKVEAGVQRILVDPVDGYGATSVSDVVCNNGNDPEIKEGATLTCGVIVDGRKRQVLVVFRDDNGTYEVDRPR